MSYYLNVIKDSPVGFWKLDEASGSVASDSSGCGNNGTYNNSPFREILPLIPGGTRGTRINSNSSITLPITKDYYGASSYEGLGTSYSSDNDFTIEIWLNQYITTSNKTPIIADITNDIGLWWENGDIVFQVNDEQIRHSVTYSKKALHLVGIYTPSSIRLYIDGVLVESKSLSKFTFTNTSISFNIGPTASANDLFVVDAPAIYRYALKDQSILKHYLQGNLSAPAIQVTYPDEGVLFSGTDAQIKSQFEYSYPINKQWESFVDDNTYYDQVKKCISFYPATGAKTFVITDSFLIPSQIGLVTSKVEWRNDLGITVRSSTDGVNYAPCENGQPLPQYSKNSFSTDNEVYIEITMTTSDASKYLPRLSFFAVSFYSNNDLYADNFGDKISSSTDYYLGSLNYPVLSRNYMNGIRPKPNSGFDISIGSEIKSIEFFLTPKNTLQANTILSSTVVPTEFKWNLAGIISKTNISAFYVNGVNKTSETSISSLLTNNEPAFITLVFSTPVSNTIKLNYGIDYSPSNLYNNISIYQKEITADICLEHYNLYTGKPSYSISENAITLTESEPKYYNNEWVVIQTV
jgi:hypothetical protein